MEELKNSGHFGTHLIKIRPFPRTLLAGQYFEAGDHDHAIAASTPWPLSLTWLHLSAGH